MLQPCKPIISILIIGGLPYSTRRHLHAPAVIAVDTKEAIAVDPVAGRAAASLLLLACLLVLDHRSATRASIYRVTDTWMLARVVALFSFDALGLQILG